MDPIKTTMARKIAKAASEFQQLRTGRSPESVNVVLSEDTLVITLYGALSPAEKVMAQTPSGAARVQEFHRQLFTTSSADLLRQIGKITGLDVQGAEVETGSGTVVHAFPTGVMVQVFHLARNAAAEPQSPSDWPSIGQFRTMLPLLENGPANPVVSA